MSLLPRGVLFISGLFLLSLACSDGGDAGAGSASTPDGAPADDGGTPPVVLGSTVAEVSVDPVDAATPLTFGHVFADGDVPANVAIALRTSSGTMLPTQVDRKATHPSGSLRHGLVSAVLPAGTSGRLELVRIAATAPPPARDVRALLDTGFDAIVTVKLAGRTLTASAKNALAKPSRWIDGAVATEWGGKIALADAGGEHPHLHARFDVRTFEGVPGERVDVTIENDWAFEAAPSNLTYDVDVAVRGKPAYEKKALTHYQRARWHRLLTPFADVNVRYDLGYLARTGALPTYDRTIVLDEKSLTAWGTTAATPVEPMEVRFINKYFPSTGGRPELGVLPGWTAGWLLSMDARARRAMLAVADSAAAFSVHYRDKNTDRVASLETYDDMTILGRPGDTKHPFPGCTGDCTVPLTADTAHQPSMSYVPYLITGDRFHLEELELWAGYNAFVSNPGYRQYGKGLLKSDQVRGFAWTLRTLGQLSFIAPDDDPQKKYFGTMLQNNLRWLIDDQVNGAAKNPLAVLDNGAALVYENGIGFAPWQDDFFTASVNVVARMGYADANVVLAYKGQAPVARMRDACWIDAAAYSMIARTTPTSPFFASYKEVHAATFANLKLADGTRYLDLPCASKEAADFRTKLDKEQNANRNPWAADEMTGYATSSEGYPSNMQPALAAAVDANVPGAKEAWATFAARSVKPTYTDSPQFAIVPR